MNRYSRYEDALQAQMSLLGTYQTSFGLRYLEELFEDMNAKHSTLKRRDPRILSQIAIRQVQEGEPVWVSMEAAEIIDHARDSFEPEEVLPSDPFVPSGFTLLPKPLILNDAPPTKQHPLRSKVGIPVRAISWTQIHNEDISTGCFWISYYIDVRDEIELGDDRWLPEQAEIMARRMPLSMVHMWQWTWGTNPLDETKGWDKFDVLPGDDIEEVYARARQQQQLIQTLWRIGSQFIPAKSAPLRQMRKQAKRKGMHSDVNIITLRRTREYDPPDEDSGRRLTVRFPVHGYWAKRHTREGTKQVWVRPHMKGPEDAELVVKKRAWEFKR